MNVTFQFYNKVTGNLVLDDSVLYISKQGKVFKYISNKDMVLMPSISYTVKNVGTRDTEENTNT